MKNVLSWLCFIITVLLILATQSFAAMQVKVEPNAGVYYFADLNSSSVGSGISLTIGKEVGKIQADHGLLGLKVGINFVNPEIESIAKSRVSTCMTFIEKKRHRSKSIITCRFIPVEETIHLTNFNVSWVAEKQFKELWFAGFEMGVDVWSSNLSSSDLGVRFGGNMAYKINDNLKLKAGGLFSGLAEADIHGQEIDISNAYFSFGGEWKF